MVLLLLLLLVARLSFRLQGSRQVRTWVPPTEFILTEYDLDLRVLSGSHEGLKVPEKVGQIMKNRPRDPLLLLLLFLKKGRGPS